jgi:hypothetical protein
VRQTSNFLWYILSHEEWKTPREGSMTTTKVMYLLAAIVPFGCVIIGILAIARHFIQTSDEHDADAAFFIS